jgi:hypothetical protein
MSYQAVDAVMQRSQTAGSERLLLMVIATHADAETLTAYLGETTLCKEANMKERNLRYTLAKLKASGELQCIIGGGRGRANLYSITLPAQSDKGAIDCPVPNNQSVTETGQQAAPLADPKGQSIAGFEEVKRGNLSSEKGQSVTETGQQAAPQPEEPERTGEGEEPRARDPRGYPFDDPAVGMFVELMNPDPELPIEYATRIAEYVTDLPLWREVLVIFSANGYRGRDGTGRNAGNVIGRYWREIEKRKQEAQSDGTRTEPRPAKPTRAETVRNRDYSVFDRAGGADAGGDSGSLPRLERVAGEVRR